MDRVGVGSETRQFALGNVKTKDSKKRRNRHLRLTATTDVGKKVNGRAHEDDRKAHSVVSDRLLSIHSRFVVRGLEAPIYDETR
jgi:hypothetical protein